MAGPIFVPCTEFMPDQADFNNPGSSNVMNVLPRTKRQTQQGNIVTYGPMTGLTVFSNALTARCQGLYAGLDTGGNVSVFAGDATKLYRLTSNSTTWGDVSGATYTTAADAMWKFAFMNGRVIATNMNDVPQGFLIDSDSSFSGLSSGAPNARYVAVVKNFLVFANTFDSTNGNQPQAVWWSALNDPTNFPTPGTAAAVQVQSSFNNLYGEGGWIQGIVGNLGTADGAVFMEHAVWRMLYAGAPAVFNFLPAEGVRGTPAPHSIVQLGAYVYYLGEDGFYVFDGTTSTPLGAQRVDKYAFTNLDQSQMHRIVGTVDPLNKLIIWAMPFVGNSNGNPNALMIYNWQLDCWTTVTGVNVETIARVLSFGFTMETLDNVDSNLDTLEPSLDSRVWTGGAVLLSAMDSSHQLNYFTGNNLAPTVDTSESEPFSGKRGLIRSARPLVDGGTPSVAIGVRDRLVDSVTFGAAVALNAIGDCPQFMSGRYIRGEITLPANSTWTHIQGLAVEGEPQGAW